MSRRKPAALLSIFVGLMALFSSSAFAQQSAQQKLERIDRDFVCPEKLADEKSRETALRRFFDSVASAQPDVTLEQLIRFRMALLYKHQCKETLANIDRSTAITHSPAPGTSRR